MSSTAVLSSPRSRADRRPTLPTLGAEPPGPWDAGHRDDEDRPAVDVRAALDDVLALVDQLEDLRRRLVERWRDLHARGGVAPVAGCTDDEWVRIVARPPRRDARDLTTLAARLSALPATAAALHRRDVTVDQAATIASATSPLSGHQLAEVDHAGAAAAADRLVRGDDPDVHGEVTVAVEHRRPSRDVRRRERRRLDGARLVAQSDLDGGGWVYAELDPEAFATVCAAVERAAGPPRPTEPRPRQRAEGLLARSRAWLGGRAAFPSSTTTSRA